MAGSQTQVPWWCSADLRISHPTLDPMELSETLNAVPTIGQRPGESRVPYGTCKSAGYWCLVYKVEYPDRPDSALLWAEQFVLNREPHFRRMLETEYDVNIYLGIHTNVLALGFNLPATPTIWRLAIPVGIEYFSG